MMVMLIERRSNHDLRHRITRARRCLKLCTVVLVLYAILALWGVYRIHGF